MSDQLASIIVPVYNDSNGLRETLSSVIEQTSYQPFELLVVDNNSIDDTPSVIEEFEAADDRIVGLQETDVQSSYAARNTGIDAARGDILVFLDADQTVTEGWLTTGIEYLLAQDTAYMAPNVQLDVPEEPSLAAQYNAATGFPIEGFIERQQYAPTACLFVTRSLIEDVGHFDERLISGGDMEFGQRVHAAGYEQQYCAPVVVRHPVRESLWALWRRNVRIGRGHCQLQRHYPERYGRVGIPPRPSGITGDQLQGLRATLTFGPIDLLLTAARAIGYYREAIGGFWR